LAVEEGVLVVVGKLVPVLEAVEEVADAGRFESKASAVKTAVKPVPFLQTDGTEGLTPAMKLTAAHYKQLASCCRKHIMFMPDTEFHREHPEQYQ